MSGKILVAYASRYGSTEEIAERIAKQFRKQGTEANLRPAYELESLEGYEKWGQSPFFLCPKAMRHNPLACI